MSTYNPNLVVPTEIVQAAYKVKVFLGVHGGTSVAGLGDVQALQRQLAEVTRERDHLRVAVTLADQLVNKARGI